MEFYPEIIAFEGTPFALNRIMLIRLLVVSLLLILFYLWTRSFQKASRNQSFVPTKFQLMGEISLNFVRTGIAHGQLGKVDGEYGISGVYLGVEAEIGRSGIKKVVGSKLTDSEVEALKAAAEAVRAKQADVQTL